LFSLKKFIYKTKRIDISCCVNGEIAIGTQTWTCSNLDVTTYRNGDTIPQITDPTVWAALTTGAWCYYDNNSANGTTYGKLYNWYAVNDPRFLAPVGYHIPTDAEWAVLTDFLGGLPVAGGKMKEVGTTNWFNPNADATNSSCFTGLPGGARISYDGAFTNISLLGYWWSSTENGTNNAWGRALTSNSGNAVRFDYNKKGGFSVRFIKD